MPHPKPSTPWRSAATIAGIYLAFSLIWILVSDRLLAALVSDSGQLTLYQTYKGLGFVILSALLLLGLIQRELRRAQKLQATLQERERFLRTLFEQSPIGLALCRLDGRLVDVNPAYTRIIGRSAEQALASSYWELTPPSYAEAEGEQLRQLEQAGTYGPYEKDYIHADGHLVPVRLQGCLVERDGERFIWSSVEDISEPKFAEQALLESEARYRHLFEANPHPMWIYDLETLAFLAVNDAAVAHYGYSRDQFLAMTIKDIRPSADVQRLLENVAQVSQGLDEAGVWRHRRSDGSIIEVEITSHTLELGGRPAELVLAHDITARRQAEAAMRQLNATLEQRVEQRTAQLEAVNRELEAFCYSVSHDLRAPLRAIDGFSGILLESYSPQFDAEGQRICRIIVENSRKMAQLIDHLLALSRFGRVSLEPTSVDMRSLAQEVFTDLTVGQDASAIRFRLGELPPAQGDPMLLRQVWSNLLGNALKFSALREHPCIEVEGRREQGAVRYAVRDNGAGFDMRYSDKLFGVFQRLHSVREFPGSGVGLAIVERIVQRHGGKVWAEGTPGVGAVFYFTLQQSEE